MRCPLHRLTGLVDHRVLKSYLPLGARKLGEGKVIIPLKVIPLKLFYYQTFFETWPG